MLLVDDQDDYDDENEKKVEGKTIRKLPITEEVVKTLCS